MAAVPLPRSVKLTPVGIVPVKLRVDVGVPVVVTVNEFAAPAVNVALTALLIVGGVPTTSNVAVLLVAPVPPSVEVIAPVVFGFVPMLVPVTLTETTHEALPARVAPDTVI